MNDQKATRRKGVWAALGVIAANYSQVRIFTMAPIYFVRRVVAWVAWVALSISLLLLGSLTGICPSVQAQELSPESTPTSNRVYHTRFKLGPGEGIHEVTIEGHGTRRCSCGPGTFQGRT